MRSSAYSNESRVDVAVFGSYSQIYRKEETLMRSGTRMFSVNADISWRKSISPYPQEGAPNDLLDIESKCGHRGTLIGRSAIAPRVARDDVATALDRLVNRQTYRADDAVCGQ
jgi:hypothetical protein